MIVREVKLHPRSPKIAPPRPLHDAWHRASRWICGFFEPGGSEWSVGDRKSAWQARSRPEGGGRKERAAMALLPAEMALFPTEIRPKADDARGQSTRNSIPRARKFDDARSAALQKTQRGPNPASHRSPGSGHMRCHPAHGRNASKMSIDHPDFMTSHRSQGEPNHPVARLPSSSAGSCGFSPARMAAGEPTAKRWPGGIMPAGK